MALSVIGNAAIFQGQNLSIWDIGAANDADVDTLVITHGVSNAAGAVPLSYTLTPLLTGAAATDPRYAVTAITNTTISITKGAGGAGSAFAGAAAVRLMVSRPHSTIR
jgi:hypothetical protein